jgi:alanine dehydrogenase
VQARSHARALVYVRPITEIRIAGRDPEKADKLADELARELGLRVRAADSYQEALRNADIVCATTHALQPVVRREWLAPGTHITSVGYNPAGRELDDQTVVDALVCVESRQAALASVPAGSNDLAQPIQEGLITPDHIQAELGELVLGTGSGRATAAQTRCTSLSASPSKTRPQPHSFWLPHGRTASGVISHSDARCDSEALAFVRLVCSRRQTQRRP